MKKSETNTAWAKEMIAEGMFARGVKCMALAACLAGAASVANAITPTGSVLTSGAAETFVSGDFSSTGVDTYVATHTLTLPSSGSYAVWDFTNAYVENSDQSIRPDNTGQISFATFKITVPEDMEITDLKWGLTGLGLYENNGNLDMVIRYSTDNTNWTTLATYDAGVVLGAQSYSTNGTIAGSTNELYIGYYSTVGNVVLKANGTNSYFEVKTAAIPEPATFAMLSGVLVLGVVFLRRKK